MYVKNENNQSISLSDYAKEISLEGLGFEQISEEEAQDALAELRITWYSDEIAPTFNQGFLDVKTLDIKAIDKNSLWNKLKKAICDFITGEGSTIWGETIEKILEIIYTIIPGGRFIKTLVKIIVKYIIGRGLGNFCPA